MVIYNQIKYRDADNLPGKWFFTWSFGNPALAIPPRSELNLGSAETQGATMELLKLPGLSVAKLAAATL